GRGDRGADLESAFAEARRANEDFRRDVLRLENHEEAGADVVIAGAGFIKAIRDIIALGGGDNCTGLRVEVRAEETTVTHYVGVNDHCKADLTEVAGTLHAVGLFACAIQGREKNRD